MYVYGPEKWRIKLSKLLFLPLCLWNCGLVVNLSYKLNVISKLSYSYINNLFLFFQLENGTWQFNLPLLKQRNYSQGSLISTYTDLIGIILECSCLCLLCEALALSGSNKFIFSGLTKQYPPVWMLLWMYFLDMINFYVSRHKVKQIILHIVDGLHLIHWKS